MAHKDIGFTKEWIEEPLSQEDYDLFVSLLAEGGHGVNWKGYRDEWDNIRNAGFDIPEKRDGLEFGHDPKNRTAYLHRFTPDGDVYNKAIRRIKK